MKRHVLVAGSLLTLAFAIPGMVNSLESEDARTTGCLPRITVSSTSSPCSNCHKDAARRTMLNQQNLCIPYCLNCHQKADMERHHTVDKPLPEDAEEADDVLHLTSSKKIACTTCHDLSRPRYDSVQWKSTSLFDRMFHKERQYKTYFLALRNDQGQLCLTCH